MAAIELFGEGQSFLGENPQVVKIKKVTIAFAAAAGVDVVTGAVQAVYPIANIPANTLILDVYANVNVAWTASVTIDIGDGTDADGFLATAKIAPQSAVSTGLIKRTSKATAEAFAGGKLYTTADTLDATVAGANPGVGTLDVYIEYIENVTPLG